MFKFFKRKALTANPLQEKAAGVVVAKVLWLQERWAGFMDRRVNRLSVRSKKFGLMVFVGLSVLICASIVIETFTRPAVFKVRRIASGKHITATGEIHSANQIPDREYNKVVAFHRYMDSVAVFNRGKFDSINRCRPGLLDSAKLLEKLYHSQNK